MTFRAGLAALTITSAALAAPVADAEPASAALGKTCAHHTTGVCKANAKHPSGATAQCKDGTYTYSAHFSGTCSRHHGVRYWYR